MITNKVIVFVEGGLVQGIYATHPDEVEITVIDNDNLKDNTLEYLIPGNYPIDEMDGKKFNQLLDDANKIVAKNIENDVEQRR